MAKAGDEIPDWLVERELKMFDLGRKARMMSKALQSLDHSLLKKFQFKEQEFSQQLSKDCKDLLNGISNSMQILGKTSQKLNGETKSICKLCLITRKRKQSTPTVP